MPVPGLCRGFVPEESALMLASHEYAIMRPPRRLIYLHSGGPLKNNGENNGFKVV